jgi:thiol-disulfide isomerase/thioredoxin
MIRSIALTAFLTLIVCSCGRASQHSTTQAAKPQTPSVIQQETPPPAPADAATQQSENQQATAAQEKGDEPEDDPRAARGDAGLERLAQLPADQQLPAGKWKAGQNYEPLVPAQPTNVGPGKVEVVEVFWLGCPHCAALEPYIQSWLKNKPAYIEFVRVPVMWGPAHRAHAHLFYTLVALNRQDLVQKAFDAIQNQHQMLFGQSEEETLKAQQAFGQANGVSAEDFAKAYNSFTVNFTSDVAKAGSQANLISLVDDLAAAEHKH